MKLMQKILVLVASAALLSINGAVASTFVPPVPQVNAKSYVLMDYETGHIIAASNEDEQHGPASLAKIMTSYIIGQEIKRGNISENDMVPVSENAWARNFPGSSLMFIEVGTEVRLQDLNLGIIVASGNDATVAMAEYIAGTEDAFAEMMNHYARQIGMEDSVFRNSHGLPHPEQVTTARDMALLAQAMIRDVPEEYALYAEREFTYNDITQRNRNTLLWDRNMQVDGIKTGYTSESGYSLVTSAVDGDTRLISVVMGTSSMNSRAAESRKLLNYGFRYFETVTAYNEGDHLVSPRIWGGEQDEIRLGVPETVVLTLPRGQRGSLQADFELNTSLEAPVAQGQTVGLVNVKLGGETLTSFPLVALESVEQGGFFKRIMDSIKKSFADE